jgi:DNA repair exonuclease SbcCD nuclease subunit
MKFCAFTDLHMDAVTCGVPRFADIREGLVEVVEQAVAQKVDAAFFLGDLCDPDAGSIVIRAVHAVQLVAKELSRAGIPSVWIAGNHDVVEDGTGRTTLTPISIVDGAHVVEGTPQRMRISCVDFALFPYPSRANRYDSEREVERMYPGYTCDAPVVALGHLQLDGARFGSETTDFARGTDVPWPVAGLMKLGVKLIACGHYHLRQTVGPVMMIGSLDRLRFDEEKHSPGWVVVEVP